MRAVVCNVNVLSNRKLQISLSPPLTHLEGMLTRNICSALSRDDDLLAGGRKEERGGGQGGKMHAGPPIVNTLSPILERDRICTPCFPMSDPKSPFPFPSFTAALEAFSFYLSLSSLCCVGFGQQIISARAASSFSSSSSDSADVYSVVAFVEATTAFTAEKESVSEFG